MSEMGPEATVREGCACVESVSADVYLIGEALRAFS
jgi:hypothetical protein